MAEYKIVCRHCDGEGVLPLPSHLEETLRYLRRAGRGRTATDLARTMKLKPTAISQRLRALEDAGLVESVKDGRKRIFVAYTPRGKKVR
jgi:DNA-binding MarR family transcriptional regulator